ncbi:hypothetical protein GUJ93_ZPchr0003g16564 [Zizania palustris]|uniref:Uncharacterized protein n=1 Tax=Zizania palustris TaxID=103762 RepID=A0A8J5RLW4_ZIZPA|nr:hypothetical protein GUJ93_ZPchr0003g16564 [Zizania palustris]
MMGGLKIPRAMVTLSLSIHRERKNSSSCLTRSPRTLHLTTYATTTCLLLVATTSTACLLLVTVTTTACLPLVVATAPTHLPLGITIAPSRLPLAVSIATTRLLLTALKRCLGLSGLYTAMTRSSLDIACSHYFTTTCAAAFDEAKICSSSRDVARLAARVRRMPTCVW